MTIQVFICHAQRTVDIKDIIRSKWRNSEFAFLWAFHTTVGDEKSPDESIHLAAAIQFSGFRSVIDTMWSVDDEVARRLCLFFTTSWSMIRGDWTAHGLGWRCTRL
ncbi:hypothetical protein BDR07DRAFT_1307318 [Suillus spraguei]|nr:hypothetical protein BDR07DRAFT_1307318 [Suillus spraguei]